MSYNGLLLEWPELRRVIAEGRCELSLTGGAAGNRNPNINDERLQSKIFAANTLLNYVEITRLELEKLHACVGKASNLKKLILHTNVLVHIPDDIGSLNELQFLDLSANKLVVLPSTIGSLSHLSTLLLAHNKISFLPDMSNLVSLQHLDVSCNQLTEFPTSFPSQSKLHTLILNSNHIRELPIEINSLSDSLKTVILSDNEIVDLPFVFCNCKRIKTLELANNKFSDSRFNKLILDPRHRTFALIDYMKKKAPKGLIRNSSGVFKLNSTKNNVGKNELISDVPVITVSYGISSILIERTKEALEFRPYIVCCVLKDCLLNAEKIKQLLKIQNKLHSSVCGKRTFASIGMHDFRKLQPPLIYGAVHPDQLMITPLHRHKKISGRELSSNLANEAELARKKEKRNVVSNTDKYIYLIQNLSLYPCLIDANGLIISVPPVTNCEETKLEVNTKDILVEVTSNVREHTCLRIMDTFIEEIVVQGCLSNLVVEQVKIRQHNGELLVVYPSRNDLQMSKCTVKRELVVDASSACET